MNEHPTPYLFHQSPDTDPRTLYSQLSTRSVDLADAIVRTMDVLFAEHAAIRAELDELRRAPVRQGWKDRREAAEYLRCHPSTIDDMAASGRLPKHLLGSKPLYRVEDLDALLVPVEIAADEDAA